MPRPKRTKIPPRSARRARAPKPPRAVLVAYESDLCRRIRAFNQHIVRLLFPALDDLGLRTDAGGMPDRLRRVFESLEVRLNATFSESELAPTLAKYADRVSKRGGQEFKRVAGIDPRKIAHLAPHLERWRNANVALIQSIPGKELSEVAKLVSNADAMGLRVEALREQILERFDVAESRAALIARDQTLKLNGQIARQNQVSAGVANYIWTISGDDKVRDTHQELDGTIQSWDDPPITNAAGDRNHPGEDYQCRCTAYPVLTELGETGTEAY